MNLMGHVLFWIIRVKMYGQKVIITGTSCFIGYHLVSALHQNGYEVYATISKEFNSYNNGIVMLTKDMFKKRDDKVYKISYSNK